MEESRGQWIPEWLRGVWWVEVNLKCINGHTQMVQLPLESYQRCDGFGACGVEWDCFAEAEERSAQVYFESPSSLE